MHKINRTIGLFVGLLITIFLVGACKSSTKKYNAKEKKLFQENLVKANKGLVHKYQDEIGAYVNRHAWNMEKTESGLWYEIVKPGKGQKAIAGNIAQLRYQVNLLDGTLCYTSDSLGVKVFKIGQGGVESGLEEGILMLNEGAKARFIMPPHLAYGLLGDENKIPTRSTIVYNVELIKLTDY